MPLLPPVTTATLSFKSIVISSFERGSSGPGLSRASTPCFLFLKDVDGRDKPGHDVEKSGTEPYQSLRFGSKFFFNPFQQSGYPWSSSSSFDANAVGLSG